MKNIGTGAKQRLITINRYGHEYQRLSCLKVVNSPHIQTPSFCMGRRLFVRPFVRFTLHDGGLFDSYLRVLLLAGIVEVC